MEICYSGHDEIVHIERAKACPLCAAIAEKEDLQAKIKELQSEIDDLWEQINHLSEEMADMADMK